MTDDAFLSGGGEMGALMRAADWSATAMGPIGGWPQSLRSALSTCLNSPILGAVLWGPELRMFYNDAYIPSMADRHPQAMGQPVSDAWGSTWEQVSPPFYHAMAGGEGFAQDRVELPLIHRGQAGTTWWNFSAAPIRGEDGHIVGLYNQGIEITEQVVAERKLHELNASLREQVEARTTERNRIWEVSRDMLLVTDSVGVWLNVNPAWTQVLGWTEDELVGRTSEWLEHPDDSQRTRGEGAKLIAGAATLEFENRIRTKAGGYRHLSWTAAQENGLIYAVARDITGEKRRAAALRLHENIVQSDRSPVCAFDTDCRLIAFNQAHNDEFYRVNGFHSKIGDVFPDLFVAEQGPVMRALMARALTGETFTVVEEFGRPELGTPSWEISYTPLRDEGGTIIGAFHQARDISARLRAEADLRNAEDALRQSQKMEAVGQLTGGIAHDFNNLLAGISGSLELIQARKKQGRIDDLDRYINAAQGAARRAAALTHRLLAFSRRQTLAPKPTDVERLVAGMADLIRGSVGPSIAVETIHPDMLWPSLIDPSQLENAILNLCINARDAMPDGGRITIRMENCHVDRPGSVEGELEPGQYVALSVSDTGTGMLPGVIEKAFDPFFTTKPIGSGTGLGLSMIYGFARQSGGSVDIASAAGEGTTVRICLPRHIGMAEDEEKAARLDDAPHAPAEETVLVVDDDVTVRMLVAEVLGDLGYTPIEAGDGAAGLRILEAGTPIDLLVTDVGLPGGMNGRQVADAARSLRPGLKILFITGYAENAVLRGGDLEDGMHILTKPFAMEALASSIRELVAG